MSIHFSTKIHSMFDVPVSPAVFVLRYSLGVSTWKVFAQRGSQKLDDLNCAFWDISRLQVHSMSRNWSSVSNRD